MIEATILPSDVEERVAEIAEDAMQIAFALIAVRLKNLGYPVTGDVTPGESFELDRLFQSFVRMMAYNNDLIAGMQDEEARYCFQHRSWSGQPSSCCCPRGG